MFKKLWEWIKRPHGLALVLFYIFTAICIAGGILFSFIGQGTAYAFCAYIFYVLAAVTFAYTVYTVVIYFPAAKHKITDKLKANQFTANVLGNYDFKTTVFACLSFGVTVAFAVMYLVSAVQYRLIWYGAIAAYYFVLILFRGCVLFANQRCERKFAERTEEYEKYKWRIYLASGFFLVLLEFAMVAAITQMMLSEHSAESGEILAIANAAYTFYKITISIYHLIKSRKLNNPVTQSLRNLNFADACMSIVSLTVLMISTFEGADSSAAMQYMKYIVGFIVCAVIIAMASVMIIRANKKLKALTVKGENANEQ